MRHCLFHLCSLLISPVLGHIGLKTKWFNCPKVLPDLHIGDLIEFERQMVERNIIENVVPSIISEGLAANPKLDSVRSKIVDFMKQDVRYQHWALYTGNASGIPMVINYRLDSIMEKVKLNYDNPNATRILFDKLQIIEEPLSNAIGESRCRINNRLDWIHQPYHPRAAVKRARSLVKTFRYNAYNNNCESIVRWARNGVRKSMQVIRRFHNISILDVQKSTRRQIWKIYDSKCENFYDDVARYKSLLNDEKDDETTENPLRKISQNVTETFPTYRSENVTNDPYFCPYQ